MQQIRLEKSEGMHAQILIRMHNFFDIWLKNLYLYLTCMIKIIRQTNHTDDIMPTRNRHNTTTERITFPPTETVRIDTATLQRLREEGLQFRREVEKSSARMFSVSSSESSVKMR